MPCHDIIVLGASAGGVEALAQIVRPLPADLPAAIFIVLHVPPHGTSVLPAILNRAGRLRASHAADGEAIEHGRIYVAPPDHHLLVRHGTVHLSRGPKENSARPAVDPLMRTAARAYGPRVVGVVLSGNLDDGTAGLVAIKRRGGVAVVQDPDEALFAGMPRSAVENAAPDHVLPLGMIPAVLRELTATEVHGSEEPESMPDDSDDAFEMAEPPRPAGPREDASGNGGHGDGSHGGSGGSRATESRPSTYTCPECHGSLWEVHDGEILRFQCRVGHRYSVDTLVAEQAVALEAALWTALRSLEEGASLSRRLAERAAQRGQGRMNARFAANAVELEQRAATVRSALLPRSMADDAHGNTQADGGSAAGATLA
jgi:two-component system, chemotaxis family, protein-glutamate methylesterase/glutaminase